MASHPNPKVHEVYRGLTRSALHGPEWFGGARFIPERLEIPLRWRKPRRVFVNSMSDLFHEDIKSDQIASIFCTMRRARRHTFQALTKRAARMRAWYATGNANWPALPNLWLGVSVESRDHIDRIDLLRETPAAVRWISCEPLLGSLGDIDLTGIDWVVVGGETGPGARPMHPDWVREIRDQCEAQGVRFFFKSWGAWAQSENLDFDPIKHNCHEVCLSINGQQYTDSLNTLECHTINGGFMTLVGKRHSGRSLDGRTWDQYPEEMR
jgi:protein gp37